MFHPESFAGPNGARSIVIRRGFTARQSIARTLYEAISRPLAGTLLAFALLVMVGSLAFAVLGGTLPRLAALVFFAGSVWSLWTPIAGTVREARAQAKSWRVGDTVTSGSTGETFWIRTPAGSWRYRWTRLREVKRMLGFVVVEVDGNAFYHIAIPTALWIDRGRQEAIDVELPADGPDPRVG